MQKTASNLYASVSGGINYEAVGNKGSVSGGQFNTASGSRSSVCGGNLNEAAGDRSTVAGGLSTMVMDVYDWAAGSCFFCDQ